MPDIVVYRFIKIHSIIMNFPVYIVTIYAIIWSIKCSFFCEYSCIIYHVHWENNVR